MSVYDIGIMDSPKLALNSESYAAAIKDEEVSILGDILRKQYEDLENLGVNILLNNNEDFDDNTKIAVFSPMIQFINDNYITIGDIDTTHSSPIRMVLAGEYLYSFICVDNLNSILPAFIDLLGCVDMDDFETIINNKYSNNIGSFRKDYLSVIHMTIEQLLNLKKLDKSVAQDNKYVKLLANYYYYQELIDFGDCEKFLYEYVCKVLRKYFDTLLWKIL